MPDHEGMDIALIGMGEYRGSENSAEAKSADEVRKQLYQLKKGFGDYGIVDLGNFRNGPKLEDTYLRLKEVLWVPNGKKYYPGNIWWKP